MDTNHRCGAHDGRLRRIRAVPVLVARAPERRPAARAAPCRSRRRDHDGPLPGDRPRGRDQAGHDPGLRGRHARRADVAQLICRRRSPPTRSWARSTAPRTRRRTGAAGSSTRSTAPRATSAVCPCGRRWSRSRRTASRSSASPPRPRSAGAGGRRAARARICARAARRVRAPDLGLGGERARATPSSASAGWRTGAARAARTTCASWPSRCGARGASATSGSTCWSPRAPPRSPRTRRSRSGTSPRRW